MQAKTKTKALVLSLCAVLLVAVSVFTTLAFLKSSDSVKNTFTVGKVAITLDEAKVNEYGVADTAATRVKENTYKLIPGHDYTKDPTVHFAADSEASYLFVKVENGLSAIEADTKINAQILANGWGSSTELTAFIIRRWTQTTLRLLLIMLFLAALRWPTMRMFPATPMPRSMLPPMPFRPTALKRLLPLGQPATFSNSR